ncbi:MAG: competence protein CoiA [Bacillus sp. (in: firmicutes)]
MLLAKDKDGTTLSLLSLSREELQMHRHNTYYCPCCGAKVHVKAGRVKIPHFAHISNQSCESASERESIEHLEGKRRLYQWFRHQGYPVSLETYFPAFKQRADLLVVCGSIQYAIEFQCSVLSLDDIMKRTDAYRQHGIIPVWIFNEPLLKRNRHTFAVSAFQWYVSSVSSLIPKLLFYSPSQHQFTVLQQLTPFSARKVFAKRYCIGADRLSFRNLIGRPDFSSFSLDGWRMAKHKWRLHAPQYAKSSPFLYRSMYESRLYPALFPQEIGIPVPYGHLFETSAIVWQFWLYHYVMRGKVIGDDLPMQAWRAGLAHCEKAKKIILRTLPSGSVIDPFLPVEHYVHMLERLGVLKRIREGTYIIQRLIEENHPGDPRQEAVFYRRVSFVYDELMKGALRS